MITIIIEFYTAQTGGEIRGGGKSSLTSKTKVC